MIYFIYPPKPYLVNPNVQIGLGLLSLATYAKELRSDVKIINGQDKNSDWYPDIPNNSTVCLSGCSVDLPVINKLGRRLKQNGCYVMIGGHISNSPLDIDALSACCTVQGPGEPMMIELAKGMRPHGYRNVSPYLTFDNYPIPDRTLLDNCGGNIFHIKSGVEAEESTTILTSRGCKYSCAFCVSGSCDSYYEYSLDRIEDELRQIEAIGIKHVRISDDNILANKDRFFKLCALLKKHDVKWRASIRTYPNEIELYERMVSSGCVELSFGVESGDDKVLKKLNKGASVKSNSKAIENALKAGVSNVRALMMMGTPGETKETLRLNMEWIEKHPRIVVCMCMFYPFPGTDVHHNSKRYGVILENLNNQNIYMFRNDGSEPEAHISIIDGLSRKELTEQYNKMKEFLVARDQGNLG